MQKLLRTTYNRFRRLIQSHSWDMVRYHPIWPTLLGVEHLPVRTVLDIGAYDGDTAKVFRRYFPQAVIHCFEPQAEPYAALSIWAAKQRGYVQPLRMALSDEPKTMDILTYPDAPRKSSMAPSAPEWLTRHPEQSRMIRVPVVCQRLDDIAATLNLEDGVLVKIDTEGHEKSVIMGGANVIRKSVASIVEVNMAHRFRQGASLCEIVGLFDDLGLAYAGNVYQGTRCKIGTVMIDALFISRKILQKMNDAT